MKRFDLDSELRRLRVPERGPEFWDAFPQRVLEELRVPPAMPPVRRASAPWWAWGFRAALACLLLGFCLAQSRVPQRCCYALLKDERQLRQTVRQFPANVRAIILDEHGLHRLIEDQP